MFSVFIQLINSAYLFELQYEIVYGGRSRNEATAIHIGYGRLEKILVCPLGQEGLWGHLQGQVQILAQITPCKTTGGDGSTEVVLYRDFAASMITDIRNVKAVIGRVKVRNLWGIVDRTYGLARTAFITEEVSDHSSDE